MLISVQYNTDDRPLPNKFLSIQAMPVTSYRPTFQSSGPPGRVGSHGRTESVGAGGTLHTPIEQSGPVSAGPASGAFGSFGIGIGGGAAWRSVKRP